MINFEKFTLGNGLRVIIHHDESTPIAAMNIIYDVGARDEDPGRTGFAHLFEHLMFGGSINIPKYDEPLEKASMDEIYNFQKNANFVKSILSMNQSEIKSIIAENFNLSSSPYTIQPGYCQF